MKRFIIVLVLVMVGLCLPQTQTTDTHDRDVGPFHRFVVKSAAGLDSIDVYGTSDTLYTDAFLCGPYMTFNVEAKDSVGTGANLDIDKIVFYSWDQDSLSEAMPIDSLTFHVTEDSSSGEITAAAKYISNMGEFSTFPSNRYGWLAVITGSSMRATRGWYLEIRGSFWSDKR